MFSKIQLCILLFITCIGLGEQLDENDLRKKIFFEELVEPRNVKFTDDSYLHTSIILSNIQPEKDGTVPKILKNLRVFSRSLLEHSEGSPVHLMFLTDEQSKFEIQKVLVEEIGRLLSYNVLKPTFILNRNRIFPRMLKVEYLKLEVFSTNYKQQIDDMRTYFGIVYEDYEIENADGTKTVVHYHTKYRQDLFYIGPMYHLEFPDSINILLVLDVDLEFRIDLLELWNENKQMNDSQLLGIGPELTRYYKKRAGSFIEKNPGTMVGQPGAWQGFNSGVVVYHLKNIRENQLFNQLITPDFYKMATDKYFLGGVGDQDLFTLLGWEYPQLFYSLPCAFNHQTYRDIDSSSWSIEEDSRQEDPEYRNCYEEAKIIHVNGLIP